MKKKFFLQLSGCEMVERFVQCFIEKSYGDWMQRDRDTVPERGASIVSRNR